MKVARGRYYSSGMTLLEVLIVVPILLFISVFLIKIINNSASAVKNVRTTEAVDAAKSLSTQKLSSTSNLKEALQASLSPDDFDKLSACLSGAGLNCLATFGSGPIALQSTTNPVLNSYLNTHLDSSLAQCTNNNCGKLSASINTQLTLSCESDTKCSNAKLIINASQLNAMTSNVKNSVVELPVSINDFKPNAIRGLCSSNEAYVSSINYADNSLDCEPAPTQSLPTNIVSNTCSTDSVSADGKSITTGLKASTLGANDCQTSRLISWSQVSAYPSPNALIPSVEEVVPVTEPDSTQIQLSGEIIIIMDDSGSMSPIRSELSEKLKDVLSPFKGSDIRIRVFSTDTFEASYSQNVYAPNNIYTYQDNTASNVFNGDSKAPLIASFNDVNISEKEKKRLIKFKINEAKLTLNTTNLTQQELNNFSTQLEQLPIISNREVKESPITTMMRIMEKRNEDPNFIDQNRKVVFLFFTDEDDQIGQLLKDYSFADGKLSKAGGVYYSPSKQVLQLKETFIYYLYQIFSSSNLIGQPVNRIEYTNSTYVAPANASLKTYQYFAPTIDMKYRYKVKGNDGVRVDNYNIRFIIDPREFNLVIPKNITTSGWHFYIPTENCESGIKQRFQTWAEKWIKHQRNKASNYYQTVATPTERDTIDWDDCKLEYRSSGRPGPTQEYGYGQGDFGIFLKDSFATYEEFYKHDHFTPVTYFNNAYKSVIDVYNQHYFPMSYYGSYVSPEMLDSSDPIEIITSMQNNQYVTQKEWKNIIPPELMYTSYYSTAPDKENMIGAYFDEPTLKDKQRFTKTSLGLSPYLSNQYKVFDVFAESLGYIFDPVQYRIINESKFTTMFKSAMDLYFGSNYKFISFVPKVNSQCPDKPQESVFFKDLIDSFDTNVAKRYELCDFNKYKDVLEDVVSDLKTFTEVASYTYNVVVSDEDQSERLKNFLNAGGKLEEIPLQITFLNPTKLNSPNPHTLNSEHYTFNVDTSGAKAIVKITFIQSETMRAHLLNYKNIKVNILSDGPH